MAEEVFVSNDSIGWSIVTLKGDDDVCTISKDLFINLFEDKTLVSGTNEENKCVNI